MDEIVKPKQGLAQSTQFNGAFRDGSDERTGFFDLLHGDLER